MLTRFDSALRYLYFSTSDDGAVDFRAEPAVLWRNLDYRPSAKFDLIKDLELEIPEVRLDCHRGAVPCRRNPD